MSEEEKKALKDCDIIFMNLEDMMSEESANDKRKSYKIIRNLIEKQQKEIVKLKKDYSDMLLEENVISKDKIKEKIKKYDEWIKEDGDYVESLEAQRYALNELLEE